MKGIFKDYIPANARILIDYKAHEKVKFSYPREWTYRKAVIRCAYPTVLAFFFILHIYPILIWVLIQMVNSVIKVATYSGPSITVTTHQTVIHHDLQAIIPYGFIIFLGFFYIIGIPLIITLLLALKKERLSNWIPKLGYWSVKLVGFVKEKNFTTGDVYNRKVVIPSFGNIYLKYDTTEDFAKYLEKVEIWELPFDCIRKILFFKKKVKHNDLFFRAVFFFSKTPKTGNMVVEFA